MQLDFAFLCEDADYDEHRLISARGVGLNIGTPTTLPASRPLTTVVVRALCEPSEFGQEHTIDVHLVSPDGQVLSQSSNTVVPFANHPSLAVGTQTGIIKMRNVTFAVAGRYEFRILLDGEEQGVAYFDLLPPPTS